MVEYSNILILIALLLSMVVLQSLIATVAHRKQSQYTPGVVDNQLDHHSFVFRSHRTFQNSLENVPIFVLTALVAMAVNVSAGLLFWLVLGFLLARFLHMVLFYMIATNKNPSPRSYFYLLGMVLQLILLGSIFLA